MGFRGTMIPILPRLGLNNGKDPVDIRDGQSPDCENVRFRLKRVEKRDGFDQYISGAVDSDAVTGIAELGLSNGTNVPVVVAGSDIVKDDSGSWSSIKGGLTITGDKDNHWHFTQSVDLLIGTNNVDPPIEWDGTGNATTLTGPPFTKAKSITEFRNYVLALNTEESSTRIRERIRWSNLSDPNTWTAADNVLLGDRSGQEGMGFGGHGNQRYAFLDHSIYEIVPTGDSVTPFEFHLAVPELGAVSGEAIVNVDGAIFFAGEKGVYLFTGGQPQYISEDIEGDWRGLNSNRLKYIVGWHNRKFNEVCFAVSPSGQATNTKILVFDYIAGNWTRFSGINVNQAGHFTRSTPLQPIVGDYNGIVYKSNTGTYLDDTAAITAYVKTKPATFQDREAGRIMKVRRLQVVANVESASGAAHKISHGYDLQPTSNETSQDITDSGAVYDTAVYDTDVFAFEGSKSIYSRVGGYGPYFQAEVKNDQASTGMTLSEILAWTIGEMNLQ